MPLLKCTLSPCLGLPRQSRFWNVVRVDPQSRSLCLDPFQESHALLKELQQQGVIGNRASLDNYRIQKTEDGESWRLVYVVGKKPTELLEIKLPLDRQLELFHL